MVTRKAVTRRRFLAMRKKKFESKPDNKAKVDD